MSVLVSFFFLALMIQGTLTDVDIVVRNGLSESAL